MAQKNIMDRFGFIYGNFVGKPSIGTSLNGYINSIKIGEPDVSISDNENNPSFAIFTQTPSAVEGSSDYVSITLDGIKTEIEIVDSTNTRKTDISNSFINLSNVSVDNASFELLRTNPKLTGNIKVVIDSEKNIYIDTFKVNDALSKEKYRKVPVSYRDYYGSNVMSIFRNVQSKDLYDVPQKYHSLFTVTNNFSEQYVDVYRSGAALNTDKMYRENYSLLAPLKVGEILPDFFVIYKIDNSPSLNLSSTDTMKYLIKNGKQIAYYDFREGTKLGTYLRNIQDGAKSFISEAYIAKNGVDDDNYENIFSGISVDKGVVANVYESVVFNDAKNQVANNNYFSKGYERNRLVSPNIINFEYMFDDEEESQFSINTYFGLYLKFNPLSENIYCFDASKDMSGDVIKTQNYVFKREGEFVKNTDNVYSIEFPDDIISAYTSKDWIRRRTANNRYSVLDDTLPNINNKYCVGENLMSLVAKEVFSQNAKTTYTSFATITLNDVLDKGEHLRIICHSADTYLHSDNVYEIIMSDASLYEKAENGLNDETINYYTHTYSTPGGTKFTKNICVHRICYYFNQANGESKTDAIKRQVYGINKAFKKFTDCPIKSLHANDNTLSIVEIYDENSPYEYFDFQRITSTILKDSERVTDEDVYKKETDKVTYFGEYSISPVIINPLIDSSSSRSWVYKKQSDLGFCPIDFEIMGTRLSYITRFMETKGYDLYEVNAKEPSDDVLYGQLYFIDDRGYVDGSPRETIPSEYDKFSLTYHKYDNDSLSVIETTKKVNLVTSFRNTNLKLVKVRSTDYKGKPLGTLQKINLYKPYELSYGVCGLLSVKDFTFNVLSDDSEALSWFINTDSTNPSKVNETYLNNEYENGRRYNEISLTSPYCVKWTFYNTDVNGNPIKLYYTDSPFGIDVYNKDVSLWDASVLQHDNNMGKIMEKIKVDRIDLSKTYEGKYIRDSILSGSLSITDIIYNNSIREYISGTTSDIEHIKAYSTSNNDIEFIYRGVKIKMSISNDEILSAQDISNFNVYVYESVSCGNKNNWEIFIDKEGMSILLIHYGMQTTIDASDNVVPSDANEPYNNVIFMSNDITSNTSLRWCRINIPISSNDLYVNSSTGELHSDIDIDDDVLPSSTSVITVIIHTDGFTIVGIMDKEEKSHLSLTNPLIYINGQGGHIELTNEILDNYCKGYDNMNIFALVREDNTDDTGMTYKNDATLDFENVGFFIKNEGEIYNDYTNMNMISVRLEQPSKISVPKKYLYYQTHFVPETIDIFEFDSIEKLDEIRGKADFLNSKYSNIVLSHINDIGEMWYEKYSENTNYCFDTVVEDNENAEENENNVTRMYAQRRSFDVIENYNVMMNPLYKTFNFTHKLSDEGKENKMFYEGYKSGVFIKTFFNSLGLQLRSPKYNNVEIKTWSLTRTKNKKFRFDVTNSLINMILNSAVFNELWNSMGINNNTYKLNFIKKSVLPNINISTKNTITVYVNRYKNRGLKTSVSSDIFIEGMEEIKNIKAELINEGGNYYVEVTPDKNINGTYYIKYNIKL